MAKSFTLQKCLCEKEPDTKNDIILDKNESHSENDWPNHLFQE